MFANTACYFCTSSTLQGGAAYFRNALNNSPCMNHSKVSYTQEVAAF